MDVTGHSTRSGPALQEAANSAHAIISSDSFIPGKLSLRGMGSLLGVLGLGVGFIATRRYNFGLSGALEQGLATENALTYYSAIAGIGGFVGSIIASNRLASLTADSVTIGALMAPVIVTVAGNVVAGFMFPSE